MLKPLVNRLLRLATTNMTMSSERAFWFVMEPISRFKVMVFWVFLLGVLTGFLEGASVGLIALSVIVITGGDQCLPQIANVIEYTGLGLCAPDSYDKEKMFIMLLIMGAAGQLIKAATQYLASVIQAYLQSNVIYYLQSRVIDHMMSLHYHQLSLYSAGDKQQFITNSQAASVVLNVLNSTVVTLFTFICYFVLLVVMSWQLSVFSALILAVVSLAILPLIRRLAHIGRQIIRNGVKLAKTSIDYFQAVKLIKLYGNDTRVSSVIKETIWRGNKLAREGTIITSVLAPVQETVIILVGVGVLLIGHYDVFESLSQPLPSLLGYVMVLYRCGGRLTELNIIRATLSKAMPKVAYVADFLNVSDKLVQRTTGERVPKDWQTISIEHLSFSYGSEQVLEDVSLTIKRGERIAVVGPSGSGKSTLIDLIAGLHDPTQGLVRIDEVKSVEALPDSWFSLFSVVSQNDLILDTTVKENLLFPNPEATNEELERACRIAYAHDFITALDQGYDTPLGERGSKISGGQIQRIALARAIIKNTSILILDEATSALDVLSEKNIVKAVQSLDEDRTVLMIAHRLSTVVNADRIIVLENGRIVDQGHHEELRSRPGLYKKMWDTQSNEH